MKQVEKKGTKKKLKQDIPASFVVQIYLICIVICMVGFSYISVPLYQLYCQSFGGGNPFVPDSPNVKTTSTNIDNASQLLSSTLKKQKFDAKVFSHEKEMKIKIDKQNMCGLNSGNNLLSNIYPNIFSFPDFLGGGKNEGENLYPLGIKSLVDVFLFKDTNIDETELSHICNEKKKFDEKFGSIQNKNGHNFKNISNIEMESKHMFFLSEQKNLTNINQITIHFNADTSDNLP